MGNLNGAYDKRVAEAANKVVAYAKAFLQNDALKYLTDGISRRKHAESIDVPPQGRFSEQAQSRS